MLVLGLVALSLTQQKPSWGEFCRLQDSVSFRCRQQSGWEVLQFPSASADLFTLPLAKTKLERLIIALMSYGLKNLTAVVCRWGRRKRGSDLFPVIKEEQS